MAFQLIGLPSAISIFLTGFITSAFLVYLAKLNNRDDFEIRDGLTASGIVVAASLLYIDYLKFTGEIPIQISNQVLAWSNSGLIEVAGLTKFFAFLIIAWKFLDYKFPGKMEFFQKVTG